jgi:hypothetical protein
MESGAYHALYAATGSGDAAAAEELYNHFLPDLHQYAEIGCPDSIRASILLAILFQSMQTDAAQVALDERQLKRQLFRRARRLLGVHDHNSHCAFPFVLRRSPEDISAVLARDPEAAERLRGLFAGFAELSRGEQEVTMLMDVLDFGPEETAELMNISLDQLAGLRTQAEAKMD